MSPWPSSCRYETLTRHRAKLARRWVPYNGGLGHSQSQWLGRTLDEAKQRDDRVIIFSHIPVYVKVDARLNSTLLTEAALDHTFTSLWWSRLPAQLLLRLTTTRRDVPCWMQEFPWRTNATLYMQTMRVIAKPGCVVAFIAGHSHKVCQHYIRFKCDTPTPYIGWVRCGLERHTSHHTSITAYKRPKLRVFALVGYEGSWGVSEGCCCLVCTRHPRFESNTYHVDTVQLSSCLRMNTKI